MNQLYAYKLKRLEKHKDNYIYTINRLYELKKITTKQLAFYNQFLLYLNAKNYKKTSNFLKLLYGKHHSHIDELPNSLYNLLKELLRINRIKKIPDHSTHTKKDDKKVMSSTTTVSNQKLILTTSNEDKLRVQTKPNLVDYEILNDHFSQVEILKVHRKQSKLRLNNKVYWLPNRNLMLYKNKLFIDKFMFSKKIKIL